MAFISQPLFCKLIQVCQLELNMKIHLVTYGDAKYALIKDYFISTAIASSFFDEIHSFSDLDIDPVFYKDVYTPLKWCRGGGYWIWKPYFIKRVMDMLNNDDILIYCDSGSMINSDGRKRFLEYIEMLKCSKNGSINFELEWKEFQYTKQEVFDYFRASQQIINSRQIMATVLLFRKCLYTSNLVNTWYDLACKHPFLFTDQKKVTQVDGFIDHRHDQSIFSVIRKKHGVETIPNETTYGPFIKDANLFPFWVTQRKP